jgi:hypothetical protein
VATGGLDSDAPQQRRESRLHRRQFVLGPRPLLAGDGWVSEQIAPSLHLSRCGDLPATSVTDARGVPWRLLGTALQSDPEAAEPREQLALHAAGSPLDAYASWCGRWILIGDAEVHLDAGGLIGCYYRTIDDGGRAELWASSSPAILASLGGGRGRLEQAPKLHPGKGMEWYPLPRSGFDGVDKLLPTQILRLSANVHPRVMPRPPLVDVAGTESYSDLVAALQRNLTTALRRLAEGEEAVWLPLTSGLDSRLVLAAASYVELPLKTFTQTYPLMSRADRSLPPLLAKEAGYEHRRLSPARGSRSRRRLFDAHTGRHCADGDRWFFAHGQWEMIPAPAMILRGGVFELGRCYFHRKFPDRRTEDLLGLLAAGFHFDEFHPSSRAHHEGIAEWVEWVARTPRRGLDWRDRLYLEQRIAGWVSTIEQALDLTSYNRVYLANSHEYLSTMLAIPEARRCRGQHHLDLIQRMAPELLRFPFNPPDDSLRLSRKLRDEWRELAARPQKRQYVAYVATRGAGHARTGFAKLRRGLRSAR